MADKDFAITRREDKGWWVVSCGTCGVEKTCFNFASVCAFIFQHMRHAEVEQ